MDDFSRRFMKQVQNTQKQQQQAQQPVVDTAYQSNLKQSEPSQPWTTERVLGNIQRISQYDPQKAQKMYSDFRYLQTDPSSKYYNPYAQATNKSVKALADYGIDVSHLDDKFFDDNRYLLSYLKYDGTTNTPSKPTKNSSYIEKVAYEYFQVWKSEGATKRAEEQWKALQEELSYWATQKDRNYSDEQIIDRIDWSKYGELVSMDENKQFQPNEYNRPIGYSKDALRGVLWAARNGVTIGNDEFGRYGRGNIDLTNRPVVDNGDGTYSTEYSFSVGIDGKEVLLPRVINGKMVSDEEAIKHYEQTGENLGIFNSIEEADAYAERLHNRFDTITLDDAIGFASNGYGNTWQKNDSIFSRLDQGNKATYSPYSVGSTMDEEMMYFRTNGFDRKWLEDNRDRIMASNDETAIKYLRNVEKAVDYTEKLKQELADMYDDISGMLLGYSDADAILEAIHNDERYKDLFELDDTLFAGTYKSGLKQTASAIDYRWADVEQKVRDLCKEIDDMKSAGEIVDLMTATPESEAGKTLQTKYKKDLGALYPTVKDKGTDAEKTAVETGKVMDFDGSVKAITEADVTPEMSAEEITKLCVDDVMGFSKTIYDYDGHKLERETAQREMDKFDEEWKALDEKVTTFTAMTNLSPTEYQQINEFAENDNPNKGYFMEILGNKEQLLTGEIGYDQYTDACRWLYYQITGKPYDDYDDPQTVRDKAEEYYALLKNTAGMSSPLQHEIDLNQNSDADEIDFDIDIPYDGERGEDEDTSLNVVLTREGDKYVFSYATGDVTGKEYYSQAEAEQLFGYEPTDQGITPEEMERYELLSARRSELQQKISEEDDWLRLNEPEYNDALSDMAFLEESWITAASVSEDLDASLIPTLKMAYGIGSTYEPTKYSSYLLYDQAVADGTLTKEDAVSEAQKSVAENINMSYMLTDMLASLDKYGVELPDGYRENFERKIKALQDDAYKSSFVMIDGLPDYDEMVTKGRGIASTTDSSYAKLLSYEGEVPDRFSDWSANYKGTIAKQLSDMGALDDRTAWVWRDVLDYITEDEKNRYFYLLGKEGTESADKYFETLIDPNKGILTVRSSIEAQEELRNYASQNGWNALGATVASFASNVLGGPIATLYEAITLATGGEVSPYNAAFSLQTGTSAFREGSKDWIHTWAGEDSIIPDMLYDALTSHVDSLINAKLTTTAFKIVGNAFSESRLGKALSKFFHNIADVESGVMSDGSLAGKIGTFVREHETLDKAVHALAPVGRFAVRATKDLAHASTMGLNAASSAYREALLKGGNPDQANAMFWATFWAETGSEAITFDNLHDSFVLGTDEERRGFIGFVKEFFKNGTGEFFGEAMNEWIEQNADRVVMGALSDYDETVKKYTDMGYPESIAREIADKQMWTDVLKAGAIGFISSNMGTTVEYGKGYLQSKLNAPKPQNVPGSKGMLTYDDVTQQMPTFGFTNESVDTEEMLRNKYNAKDSVILMHMFKGDQSAASVGVASLLGGDSQSARVASQNIVAKMAKGKPKVVARGMQALLKAFPTSEHTNSMTIEQFKNVITMAAVTDGKANKALQTVFNKASRYGENTVEQKITSLDVDRILKGIVADQATPEFYKTYLNNIKQQRIANATVQIATANGTKEAIETAEKKVKEARTNLQTAQKTAEDAHNTVDVVADSVVATVNDYIPEDPNEPVVKENAGAFEQAQNELEGAVNAAKVADDAVAVQQQKLEDAQAELEKVQEEGMTKSRTEAEAQIAQEDLDAEVAKQEQEKQENEQAVVAYPPTKKFNKPITVPTTNGDVKLTGIFAVVGDNTKIYTTPNGYISDNEINWENYDGDLPNAFDAEIENPIKPAVWLDHSIKGEVGDKTVDIVGVAGMYEEDFVVMDAQGNLYYTYNNGVDFSPDDSSFLYDSVLDDNGDLIDLPEITREAQYEQQAEVSMPAGFIAYPQGPVNATLKENGETIEIAGIIDGSSPVMYVATNGDVFDSNDVIDEDENFNYWWSTQYDVEAPELEMYAPEYDLSYSDFDEFDYENEFVEDEESEDEGKPVTMQGVWGDNQYLGFKIVDNIPEATTGSSVVDVTGVYYDPDTQTVYASVVDQMDGYTQLIEASKLQYPDDMEQDKQYVNEIIDQMTALHTAHANQQYDDLNAFLQAKKDEHKASVDTQGETYGPSVAVDMQQTEPEEGFKYHVGTVGGNKAIIAPILGSADSWQIDGITLNADGDLVYTKHNVTNGVVDAHEHDVSTKPFLEWAIEAVDHLGEITTVNDDIINSAKEWLNDQLHYADDDSAPDNDTYFASEPVLNTGDILESKAEGKVNPKTGEVLYDWQNPKWHGAVREAIAKENPKSKKFKAWQNLDGMKFYNAHGDEVSNDVGRKYFTDENGNPIKYYRGYGSFGKHLFVQHESKGNGKSGATVNFYMNKISTAQSYAGTTKIAELRYIDNWETAKAAMQDMGLDLIEVYDPSGSGTPGYEVVQKNSWTGELEPAEGKASVFFKENELSRFRNTYGGNLKSKGIHVGFITGKNILVLDNLHTNYDSIYASVNALDGSHMSGNYKTRIWAEWAFEHGYDTVVFDEVSDNVWGGGEYGWEVVTSSGPQYKSIWNKGSYSSSNSNILALKTNPNSKYVKKAGDPVTFKATNKPVTEAFEEARNELREGKALEDMTSEEKKAFLDKLMATDELKWAEANSSPDQTLPYEITAAIRAYDDDDEVGSVERLKKAGVPDKTIEYIREGATYAEAVESLFSNADVQKMHAIRDKVAYDLGSAVIDENGKASYTGTVDHNRQLHVIFGLPGSGKSSLADPLSQQTHSRIDDSDVVKKLHWKNQKGGNDNPLHNESRFIADQAENLMIQNGDNVILPIVGHRYDSVKRQLGKFQKAGYTINFHRVDIPWNESVARALNRLAEDNRYVSIPYLMGEDSTKLSPQKIKDTFDRLVKEGYANGGYATWNNNVPYGTPPIPTGYSNKDLVTITGGAFGRSQGTGNGLGGRGHLRLSETPQIQALKVTPKTNTERQAEKVKDNLKSPQQIANRLATDLGIGNYLGSNEFGKSPNLTPDTRGFYERHAKLVALKNQYLGEYTHTFHEIGHGLADKLGITGTDAMVAQMLIDSPAFGTKYAVDELHSEAMAEFVWRWMESTKSAVDFAGQGFVDMFERELLNHPAINKVVQKARNDLQDFINANLNSQLETTIRFNADPKNQKFTKMVKQAIVELADSTSIADDVDRKANSNGLLRNQALFANHSQRRAVMNLTDHLTDANGIIIADGLAKRLKDAGLDASNEKMLHLFEKYCLLLHSVDRHAQHKEVFGSYMSMDAIKAEANRIANEHPEIARAEKAYQEFKHDFLTAWMVDTGYWTADFLAHLEEMYPHYVPTYRVRSAKEAPQDTGFGRSAKKYTMKRATGGTEDIYSPMYSLISMVDQITSMVGVNQVGQVFDQLYEENEGMGIFGRRIFGSTNPNYTPSDALNVKQQQLNDLLKDKVSSDLMERVMEITQSQPGYNESGKRDARTISIHRQNGEVVRYEIDSPELFKLLTGAQGTSGIRLLQKIGTLTRTMSMLTTGSNPLFALRNAVRDYQNSVNYGSWASNYLSGIPKWIKAFAEVVRESDDVKQYYALGGGGWQRIEQNRAKSLRQIETEMFGDDKSTLGKKGKYAGKQILKLVTAEWLNEKIEQASRYVEYKYGQHDLNSVEGLHEAFQASQDVTVDFSRSGNSELAYVLKKFVPFFNASMQGVYRTGRQFTQAERGETVRDALGNIDIGETASNVMHSRVATRLTKTIVNTGLMSALASALVFKFGSPDDKDEYMMLSDGIKANHLILPNPFKGEDGVPFLRIPLAQDPLGYAVHGLVTNAMANGSDDEMAITLAATADVILDNLNPLGSGTILQPYIDVSHNRTWYGSNLVRTMQEDWVDKAGQYNEDTPELFKWFGRLINQSPEVVEYLASQYTGFAGQIAIPMMSKDSNGNLGGFKALWNSVVRKWTSDPATSNDVTSNFYDMKNVLATVTGEANADRPQGLFLRSLTQDEVDRAYEEASAMTKAGGVVYETSKIINEAYKKIDAINANGALSDSEKTHLTREERMKMLDQVQAANEQMQAWYKKYVRGESLTDRTLGALQKMFTGGKVAHIKDDVEKMPEIFQADEDAIYMQMCTEMYYDPNSEGYQKTASIPHPSRSFTLKDRSGDEEDYTITDEEWPVYTAVYKSEYEAYLTKNSVRWQTMDDKQRYKLLKSAHTSANGKMRERYARDHGIKLK